MIFIMFGAPASGKGTHSANLSNALNIPCISTGDMLRAEEAKDSPIWRIAQSCMSQGKLVPDWSVLSLVCNRIAEQDCNNGFILDGFPRTKEQKEALDGMLSAIGKKVTAVIQLDVTQEELEARNQSRAAEARGNGKPTRPDDDPEVFKKRLVTYGEWTAPVLDLYRSEGTKIKVINANGKKADTAHSVNEAATSVGATLKAPTVENLESVRELGSRVDKPKDLWML